jgi:hypothetical protein
VTWGETDRMKRRDVAGDLYTHIAFLFSATSSVYFKVRYHHCLGGLVHQDSLLRRSNQVLHLGVLEGLNGKYYQEMWLRALMTFLV